jgi:glutamine amidotransferase PdxT
MLSYTSAIENGLASVCMCANWYGKERNTFRARIEVHGGLHVTMRSHRALVVFLRDLVIENPSQKVSVFAWQDA